MKKVIFSLMLVLTAAFAMNTVNAQTTSGAKIDFTKDTHDY